MNVMVVYGAVGDNPTPDDKDTLVQVESICGALEQLGHTSTPVACTLNLADLQLAVSTLEPWLAFNLVESIAGSARYAPLATQVIEDAHLPCTGTPADGLYLSTNKLLAKTLLQSCGIPTPPWVSAADLEANGLAPEGTVILKSVWEHASIGIDEHAVISPENREALRQALRQRQPLLGGLGFAERYIPGREFNVSVLERNHQWVVLPIAEIVFSEFPEGAPEIVGYDAKWAPQSWAYQRTQRRIDEAPADRPLFARLADLACASCTALGVRGYARVDFRVDDNGQPWVLEVNANPCLSPDAGFAAAAHAAGLTYNVMIDAIIRAARPEADKRTHHAEKVAPRSASYSSPPPFVLDQTLQAADRSAIAQLLTSTDYFSCDEVDVALSLVDETLDHADRSGYHFLLARQAGRLVGYCCYGQVPATQDSYDLYWMAVDREWQGQGVGRALLQRTESLVAAAHGRTIYIETSTRAQYEPTRRFYQTNGYHPVARFPHFYRPGDGKVVYAKSFAPLTQAPTAVAASPRHLPAPPTVSRDVSSAPVSPSRT